ncbi:MAG: pyridoxamine 5'-phosphate oxidase family protein [Pseudomonadota bacterium]|jgi:PPOX class probable FMN-dependent enzyme
MDTAPNHLIQDLPSLERLYGDAVPASLTKEFDHIHPLYRPFIEAAPFVALATSGPGGLDCSPRGDRPGFVRVADERTVLLPDRRGNNRIDSLRNVLADPRVALLFLVPGVAEALRINGRASISIDPDLVDSFAVDGRAPRTVLVVRVESVYYQCAKSIVRSRLWDPGARIERSALPSTGTMQAAFTRGAVDAADYDAGLAERIRNQLY